MAIKRESFKGLMFTLRVAKARYSPANKTTPLQAKRNDNQVNDSSEVQTPTMAGKSLAYCKKDINVIW